jgi:hypothetical protein
MDLDWKKTLPFIGAMATGGVPALITAAASAIGDALGTTVTPTPEGIDQAIKGATPEQMAALRTADNTLKIRMRELDTEDRKTAAEVEKVYIGDVDAARHAHAQTQGVLYLGYLINAASYFCVGGVLWGCFAVLGGSGKLNIDPGIAAMVGGIVGSGLQWLLSNAAQANGFFFGSSPSARQVSTELAKRAGDAATTAASKK